MKSRTLYQCEICGREYQKESVALECESNHKKPKKVEKPLYDVADNKVNYPASVNVIFSDGTSARYYRKRGRVMSEKEAFKVVAEWICKQTRQRQYPSEELDSLSIALKTLKQSLESEESE